MSYCKSTILVSHVHQDMFYSLLYLRFMFFNKNKRITENRVDSRVILILIFKYLVISTHTKSYLRQTARFHVNNLEDKEATATCINCLPFQEISVTFQVRLYR